MSHRQLVLIAALAVTAVAPATAAAAPTVSVTGDTGQPVPLNTASTLGIRNMDVTAAVSVPETDATAYRTQVVDQAGTAASDLSPCRDTQFGPTWNTTPTTAATAPTAWSCATSATTTAPAPPRARRVFRYAINAGVAVTPPPARLLTRAPNSFVTNTHEIGVSLNPGTSIYEVRYALGGVVGPDGAISGPSAETFLNTTTGLASFRFDKPGSYVIVARAQRNSFFTPWSGAVNVTAVAPFDLERVTFPDSRGPSYKLRGQLRERVARGKVKISIAKRWKKGKFRSIGSAKLNSKGRFTKRFRVRGYGKYRLRYTYKGSNLVTAGRVTERITISKRFFFR